MCVRPKGFLVDRSLIAVLDRGFTQIDKFLESEPVRHTGGVAGTQTALRNIRSADRGTLCHTTAQSAFGNL